MSRSTTRLLSWLSGPLLAVSLVAFAVIGGGGPGFFLMSLYGGVLFMFGAPLLQFILFRTARLHARYAMACGVALLIMLGVLMIPAFMGVFSFW
ncbi:hypothetical protein SAMN05216350_101295 [Polaromonas sp. YR568]|uniref:hypothetical protein n=1 Tax=Polaromonas sp. YR568 TaxID=1855301 RepID=UPI0008E66CBF|nr:hypothetical protein [Polaromonas sp. YR568]SFU31929.1 hypothetical protein SAMN05216350_101295 [Polaromonas sp. YR568]